MFAGLQRNAGEVNRFSHNREPASFDKQTVIRMIRDTLYSFAVVDVSAGAKLTVPDASERYLSVARPESRHRSSLRRQRPVGPAARRSSQETSVELVETTAPPHRRLDPLAPIRAFALRVERLATSQHVHVLLDPPGSRLLPLGGTETVQNGKAVLASEILEHRLRLRPRG
jgi:Protein of unknown function (DUF1254)